MRAPRVSKVRPLGVSLARFSSALAVCAAVIGAAHGATFLRWDPDATAAGNSASGAGLGGAGVWNAANTNWWDGLADTIWNSSASAVFAGTAGAVTLGSPITAANLLFSASGYSLAGNTLTLGNDAIINLDDGAGGAVNTTIGSTLTGGGAGMQLNGNGGTLTVTGPASGLAGAIKFHSGTMVVKTNTSSLGSTLGLTFLGSSSFVLDNEGAAGATSLNLGALNFGSGATAGGDGVIRLERSATQNMSVNFTSMTRAAGATGLFWANTNSASFGSNSFFTVNGGTLGVLLGMFAKSNTGDAGIAFYDTGTGTIRPLTYVEANTQIVNGGASIVTGAPNTRYVRLDSTPTTQGSATVRTLHMNGGVNIALSSGATFQIDGGAGGSDIGVLLKTGGNSSAISAASGTPVLTAGSATRELVIRTDAAADQLTISIPINNTGALTKSGDGTLILTNAGNAFGGTTYVNGGTLTISGAGALGTLTAPVVLSGGTYDIRSDADVATTKNVTVTGTSGITFRNLSSGTPRTLTFGTLAIGNQVLTVTPGTAGFAVNFSGAVTFTDALSPVINVTGTQAFTAPAMTLAGTVSGPSGLVKRGSGTLSLTNTNSFGGAGSSVEIQGGLLVINSNAALGDVNNDVILNTASATEGLVTTASVTAGAGRSLMLAGAANMLNVNTGTLQWDGVVSGPAATGLTKLGAGTLTLTNTTNTFGQAGSVIDVQAGNLAITANGALGNANNTVNLNTAGKFSATLPLGGMVLSQAFILSQSGNTIEVLDSLDPGKALTLNGVISSSVSPASLTKSGSGGLVLTNAANSFGGGGSTLDIQGGNLTVSSGGALGNPANIVKLTQNGATEKFVGDGTSVARQNFTLAQPANTSAIFDVTPGNTFTISGVVSSTNAIDLIKTGSGTLVLGNTNSFGGSGHMVEIQGGLLAAATDAALGSSFNTVKLSANGLDEGFRATGSFSSARTFNLANTAAFGNTIDVSQGDALTLSVAFGRPNGETAALFKEGPGRLTLTAAQSAAWTGAVTINGGAIRISNATNPLGATSTGTTINNQGTLELTGNQTFSEPLTINTPGAPGQSTTMAGSEFAGVLRSVPGSGGTYAGAITLNGATSDNTTRTVVFSADTSTTLTLSTASSISVNNGGGGATRVTNLVLAGGSTNNNTLGSAISKIGGTLNLAKSGIGTWIIAPPAGGPQPPVSDVTILGGMLQVNAQAITGGGGVILPSGASLSFNGSGTFSYNNTSAIADKTQPLNTLSFNSGEGVVRLERASAGFKETISFTSMAARPAGVTGLFLANGSGAIFGGATPTTKVTIGGIAVGTFLGPGLFARDTQAPAETFFAWYNPATATVRPILYTGTPDTNAVQTAGGANALTTVSSPTPKQVRVTGSVTGQNTVSVLSLHLSGASATGITLNPSQTLTVNSGGAGGILKTLGNATISGGTGITAGSGQELVIRSDLGTDTLTITTPILNSTGALTKAGAGKLSLSGTQSWTGATSVTGGTLEIVGAAALAGNSSLSLSGAILSIQDSGDGRGSTEAINLGKNVTVSGAAAGVTVAKNGTTGPRALNKTVTLGTLSIGNDTLTATVNDQYGVQFGATTLTNAQPATFNVNGIQASNVVPGLTLGAVSSTGGVGLIKAGTGTLLLGDNSVANNFGGAGAIIEIQGGVLAAGSDNALGNAANTVFINTNSSSLGFRAIGTFATDRLFTLNGTTNNEIEVTQGNVLTLNQPLNITSQTMVFDKRDNGVLELGADSPSAWTGAFNINAGAVRLKTGGAFGTPARGITVPNVVGAAVQLSGAGVTYNAHATSLSNTGINSGGALENISGNNTWAGAITLANAATIGSTIGTLNLIGGISGAQNLTLTGAGDINLTTVALPAIGALTKTGAGTATLGVASPAFVNTLTVNGGTFALRGSGVLIGGTGAITVNPGGTLSIDDSVGSPLPGRLGSGTSARTISLLGGVFRYDGNGANSADTFGALTTGTGGSAIISQPAAGRTNTLTFPSMAIAVTSGSVAVSGTNVGTPENRILSTTVPSGLTDGIYPGVSVNGENFATYAGAQTWTANTVNNTNVVTLSGSNPTPTTKQLVIGQILSSHSNIPAGARITGIIDDLTFTISVPATGTSAQSTNFSLVGLAPFASYEQNPNITSSAVNSTDTFVVTASTITASLTASKTINALKIDGGFVAGGAPETTLTLDTGGLLSTGGSNTVSVPVLAFGAQGFVHVNAGSQLTITSSLTGGSGFVKAGDGLLILDTPVSAVPGLGGNTALTGTHNFNAGTVQIGAVAGGINNLFAPGVALRINSGATLDLHGNLQYFGPILTDSGIGGSGGAYGMVTSTGGMGTLVANLDGTSRNWSANMIGTMGFSRSGQSTLTVYSPQTYTGPTQINGGTTTLRDIGSFANTSALDVNYATLNFDNAVGTGDLGDRVADGAPVTVRGGVLAMAGRPQTVSSETMGALTLARGFSTFTVNASSGAAATGIVSGEFNFASLARQPGAVANFVGQINGTASALGLIGNNPRVSFNTPPALVNGIIGPWAIVTGTSSMPEFASVAAGVGVGPLGGTGFPLYDSTSPALSSGTATQNVRILAAGSVASSVATINSLNIVGNFTNALTFGAGTQTLNLVSGGLIKSGATGANSIGTVAVPGELTSGGITAGLASELVIYHGTSGQTLTINSKIRNNGAASATTALVLAGAGTISLAPQASNTFTGGTTVNSIAVNTTGAVGAIVFPNAANPANGLIINGAAVTLTAPGQIGSSNTVTISGPASLTFRGDNAIGGLIFDNSGGTSSPVVNTFTSSTADGTLDIGAAGVTASSSNIATFSTIVGKLDLGSGAPKPFVINPIAFNGEEISPSQATLVLQGLTGGSAGIDKSGDGVLQFNAQNVFSGPLNVMAGGVQFGVGNAGSRFSTLSLGAAARLNLNGQSSVVGALGGAGLVTNASNTDATLTVGFNNEDSIFSGQVRGISNGNQNSIYLTKIGGGKMEFTGLGDTTGNLIVRGGELNYHDGGHSNFTGNTVNTHGTLTLDNTAANWNSRLGGTTTLGTLTMGGGTFNLLGNSISDTTETVATFTVSSGASVMNLTADPNTITTVQVGTSFSSPQVGGTLLIHGLTANDPLNPGDATISLGTVNFNAPSGAGIGFPFTEQPIRPDLIGDAAPAGFGTGFIVKDAFSGRLRLLDPFSEVLDTLPDGSTAPANYDFTSSQNITENTTAYSMVLHDGVGIVSSTPATHGVFGPNGSLLTMQVSSGGILTVENAKALIQVGLLRGNANNSLFFQNPGDLTVVGDVTAGTGGLTKSGAGFLKLSGRGYYTAPTVVNDGWLVLDGPANNSIAVVSGATVSSAPALVVNGGTVDLVGKDQVFGTLSTNNASADAGGLISSSGGPATLTTAATGSATFSGQIGGPLNFVASLPNVTLALSSDNPYTGTTTARGGTLRLQDQGALMNTSSIELNYGTLQLDQSQLNPAGVLNPTRLSSTVPITMQGATFTLSSGGSMDASASVGNGAGITLQGGANTITVSIPGSQGSTGSLAIGNLDHAGNETATVNFTGSGSFASPGFNNAHMFLDQVNGSGVVLPGKIIGPWAVVNGNDFATAKNGAAPFEIGALGNTGQGFFGYDSTNVSTATTGANVSDNSSRTISASVAINSLRAGSSSSVTLTLNPSVTLTFGNGISGGLLTNSSTAYQITGDPVTSSITSGGSSLFVFINQNTTTVSVPIIGTDVNLVKSGAGALTLTGANTYTGATVVNQGTLTANVTGADAVSTVAIPGDLMINNATVTLQTANQIVNTASVTMDGPGALNIPLVNSLASLVFNNRGGNSNPTVTVQTPAPPIGQPEAEARLVLTNSNAITSTNHGFTTTPIITGTELRFGSATPVITTSGEATNSLLINAPIHNAGGVIQKAGAGSLVLNPTLGAKVSETVSGSNNVHLDGGTTALRVGMLISGTGIPAGSTITVVEPSGFDIKISNAATVSNSSVNLTYSGSTVNNGFKITTGVIVFGQSSNTYNGAVVSGPVGSGTLTLENGAAIMSDNTVRTIHNPVAVNGDFIFGAPTGSAATVLAGGGVNLAGTVTFTAGAHSIEVNSAMNTSEISGVIAAGGSTLTKTGPGTLVLSNPGNVTPNNLGGTFTVAGGVLMNGVADAIPASTDLSISSGAVFDVNGIDQSLRTLSGEGVVGSSSILNAATLTIGSGGMSSVFSGSITGQVSSPGATVSLTKVGTGTFTLDGPNTYRGETHVDGGVLKLNPTATPGESTLALNADFIVNANAIAEINGIISAGAGGSLQAKGDISGTATIRGYGTLAVNTTIDDKGVLQPIVGYPGIRMEVNDHTLDMLAGSTLRLQVDSAQYNRVMLTGDYSDLALSNGGWTLKLENLDVVNPQGMTFVLFDGKDDGFYSLNGNNQFTDDVGNYTIDWSGVPGWQLDPNLPPQDKGIHYHFGSNSIYLTGVVPEPGAGSMVLGGLAVMLGLQRFRRRRN